ncbi:hypothetical protein ACWEF6_02805 [Amycolatopsis sp. NPDC004772]
MTDARELVDQLAGSTVYVGGGEYSADALVPAPFAALRAVLDLHPPSTLNAAIMPEKFGPGRCAYCGLGAPTREYRDKPWPDRPELDMHEHTAPEPWCLTCAGPDDDSTEPWPCPTVRAITTALEAS